MLLKEKNAIITGSVQGIGNEIAHAFAKEGANIALVDIQERVHSVAKEFQNQYPNNKFLSFQADLTDVERIQNMVDEIITDFQKVDILVNNAGIYQTKHFLEVTAEDWDQTLSINLKSMFLVTQRIIPLMMKQNNGCILNMSSIAGRSGRPYSPHYAASKAAVISLTKSTAEAFGKYGIRTNALCPGIIRTTMIEKIMATRAMMEDTDESMIEKRYLANIPQNRLGDPLDVANAALLLCSNLSGYVNGQALNVCGGYEMD